MTAGHGHNGDRRIVVRFGDEVLEAGFTTVPNLVLEHYAALGITSDEMMFTIHVWQYWWTERDPYPSLATVAAKMGKSWRTAHRYAKSLQKKQMLRITHRDRDDGGQSTSEYDFEPLINAVVQSARTARLEPSTPADTFGRGDLTDMAGEALTRASHEEDQELSRHMEVDNSKSITPNERKALTNLIQDIARELHDRAPLQSTVGRVLNLYRKSEVDFETFIGFIYVARARTQQRTPSIRAGDSGERNKVPYFFAVLEDLMEGRDLEK